MSRPATIRAILYACPEAGRGGDLNDPFDVTLEQALAAIGGEPRGFAEPDGSFAFRAADSDGRVDGELYDFEAPGGEARVHHVDVRGSADADVWRRLFEILSPRGVERLVVFLPESGETMPAEEFLRRTGST